MRSRSTISVLAASGDGRMFGPETALARSQISDDGNRESYLEGFARIARDHVIRPPLGGLAFDVAMLSAT